MGVQNGVSVGEAVGVKDGKGFSVTAGVWAFAAWACFEISGHRKNPKSPTAPNPIAMVRNDKIPELRRFGNQCGGIASMVGSKPGSARMAVGPKRRSQRSVSLLTLISPHIRDARP